MFARLDLFYSVNAVSPERLTSALFGQLSEDSSGLRTWRTWWLVRAVVPPPIGDKVVETITLVTRLFVRSSGRSVGGFDGEAPPAER